MAASIARVLVDSPLPQLDRLFDYAIPASLAPVALPGVRVKVPLRSATRIADGFIIEVVDSIEYTGALSELDSVVSPVRILAPEVYELARRVADRAAGVASDVLRLAVPPRQVRVEKTWMPIEASPTQPSQAGAFPGYSGLGGLVASGGRAAVSAIPGVTRLRSGEWVGEWAVTMAALAAQCVESGTSAILAIPDFRDQRQLEATLAEVLSPEQIARLDARQSGPNRYRALLACRSDTPLAIIGNRSVIYAPASRLGLIAIWDDGDPSYGEPLAPYVHLRDAALVRQEQQGSALIFLQHAPTTEVERLTEIGWLERVRPDRQRKPRVIPTSGQASRDPMAERARIPSTAWSQARSALEFGPVLVQVARPGYSPRLACADCGETARCRFCNGPLAVARAGSAPACRWCGALAADWVCKNCAGTKFRFIGVGAERTAYELGRAFPGVRVVVADGEKPELVIGDEPALVIATRGAEPIASGGYRAVLLLDGEKMLSRESLRAAEDCLRWWANAAALAATGARVILVGVGGTLASAMATWQLDSFARSELVDRRQLRFPPAVRVATVTGSVAQLAAALAPLPDDGVDVLGPTPLTPESKSVGSDGQGSVRAIVRFEYSKGAEVAAALRTEVLRASSRARRPARGEVAPPQLRVRFDDADPFD